MEISNFAFELVERAEKSCSKQFREIDKTALVNQRKVLEAFQSEGVQQRHFKATSGYGYDDQGRDALSRIFARVFKAESAIVSPMIASGTHALTVALFGILRPNDTMLAVTGNPYDTLREVIGGDKIGSLKDFNINYKQCDLINGKPDLNKIAHELKMDPSIKLVFIGRSRGYEWRDALGIDEIAEICKTVRGINKDVVIMADNCYGEFIDVREPVEAGADIAVGSLIKNPGGGIAPTGGYIVGSKHAVEQAAFRLTAPSIGSEVGSYIGGYTAYYQGLFFSPHVVACALKGSVLFGRVFDMLGYETMPGADSIPRDIIRSIKFDREEELVAFCRTIQVVSPVDSNVVPYPWDMPGYTDQVIMAAGTFIEGASIELSCDSPIRSPYIAYLQGGLTYEHVKLAAMAAVTALKK